MKDKVRVAVYLTQEQHEHAMTRPVSMSEYIRALIDRDMGRPKRR